MTHWEVKTVIAVWYFWRLNCLLPKYLSAMTLGWKTHQCHLQWAAHKLPCFWESDFFLSSPFKWDLYVVNRTTLRSDQLLFGASFSAKSSKMWGRVSKLHCFIPDGKHSACNGERTLVSHSKIYPLIFLLCFSNNFNKVWTPAETLRQPYCRPFSFPQNYTIFSMFYVSLSCRLHKRCYINIVCNNGYTLLASITSTDMMYAAL